MLTQIMKNITDTIQTHSMLKKGDAITAALSGGADSVCLLLVLKRLEEKLTLDIDAIHVNHCIRGNEADMDEQFCREFCEKLGIPLTVRRVNVPEIAAKERVSVEEAARNVRYALFAEHTSNGKLATAHTASDNAETLILNLVRGTGLKGLCGIPPVRDNIIRPLINITRQDVENFLEECDQNFVTDSTNLSLDYTRNRIRSKILPEILQINRGFFKTFCAELKIFSEENFFIEKSAKNAYNICIDKNGLYGLEKYDAVIRKRCISTFLKENGLSVSFDKINAVDGILENGGKINLEKNAYAVCQKNVLTILRTPPNAMKFKQTLLCNGKNSIFDGITVTAEIKNDSKGIIDIDRVNGSIILRSRVNGDRIRLVGREHTSSVKKLLNEKIRADMRPFIHFLADSEGVIYIEGIGAAERVKTNADTKKSLHISIGCDTNA